MPVSDQKRNVFLDWTRKLHQWEYAHRYQSMANEQHNLLLGIPAIVITALIAATIAAMSPLTSTTQFFVIIAATIAAVFTGLQTFLKPSELAEKHRLASETYEDLRHRMEYLLASDDSRDISGDVERLKGEWDRIQAPNVAAKHWAAAKGQVASLGTYPGLLRLTAITSEATPASLPFSTIELLPTTPNKTDNT